MAGLDGTKWTYAELAARANRIASVLVDDLGLVPGQPRAAARPELARRCAACWFGVVKAGGIVVATMPLLRAKELTDIMQQSARSRTRCATRACWPSSTPRAPTARRCAHVLHVRRRRPGVARRARARQAGDVRERRHRGRRHGADRVHVGHDRQAEGHDALPPRRHRRMRLLAAPRAARVARRPLHRQPAARRSRSDWAGCCCSRCASAPRRC